MNRTLYKYFVFSDVHGENDALMSALAEAGYDPNNKTHKLVSLGDDFDRGPDSNKIYSLLTRTNRNICVKGNHDVMFEEYLEKGMDGEYVLFNILHNGLAETIESFSGLEGKSFTPKMVDEARKYIGNNVLYWLKHKPLYYETEHFIFCHAGIDPDLTDWKKTSEHFMLWDIEHSHEVCRHTRKIVMIGHHHARRVRANGEAVGIHSGEINQLTYYNEVDGKNYKLQNFGNTDENRPYVYGNKIAIDGLTNLTHKVNVVVVQDYELEDTPDTTVKPSEPTTPNIQYSSDGITITANANFYNYYDMAYNNVYTTTGRF